MHPRSGSVAKKHNIHIIGLGAVGRFTAAAIRAAPNPRRVTLLAHTRHIRAQFVDNDNAINFERYDGSVTKIRGCHIDMIPGFVRRKHGISESEDPSFFNDPGPNAVQRAKALRELLLGSGSTHSPDHHHASAHVDTEKEDIEDPIDCLVVATKAHRTVVAIESIRHRLHRDSSILFLQNGMGQIDEVNQKIFPDPATRPQYLPAIISHGVHASFNRDMYVRHTGIGEVRFSAPLRPGETSLPGSADHLIETMTRAPLLSAQYLPHHRFLEHAFLKVAVNAVINPLTALMDSRNGSLLNNFNLQSTMRLLIAEISLIISSLPEFAATRNKQQQSQSQSQLPTTSSESELHDQGQQQQRTSAQNLFDPAALEHAVVKTCFATKNNLSSMLVDVRKGQMTEMEYINRYLIRRGEEMGIAAPVNQFVAAAVVGKQIMVKADDENNVPLA